MIASRRRCIDSAVALRNDDPDAATALLNRANAYDMADARPFFAAADTALAQGDPARADALVEMALRLRPVDPRIQQRAGRYWILRNDIKRAIHHWSLALEASTAPRRELFPLLLKLAEDPRTRSAFETLVASPPFWWDSFFPEVAEQAAKIDTVQQLYSLRRKPRHAPITVSERKSYVARLTKDGLTDQAYIVWVKGLTPAQRGTLGLLYNGSFELEPGNWGFDWHIRPSRGLRIERVYTYGSDKDKALHLMFYRHKTHFDDLHQTPFLNAGTYRLDGRVRTESLDTKKGLKWIVRCLLPRKEGFGGKRALSGRQRMASFWIRVPGSRYLHAAGSSAPQSRETPTGTGDHGPCLVRRHGYPQKATTGKSS